MLSPTCHVCIPLSMPPTVGGTDVPFSFLAWHFLGVDSSPAVKLPSLVVDLPAVLVSPTSLTHSATIPPQRSAYFLTSHAGWRKDNCYALRDGAPFAPGVTNCNSFPQRIRRGSGRIYLCLPSPTATFTAAAHAHYSLRASTLALLAVAPHHLSGDVPSACGPAAITCFAYPTSLPRLLPTTCHLPTHHPTLPKRWDKRDTHHFAV